MTLTIGLIGCGRWGTIHHATLMSLKQEGYLDRLVVCDIDATARDAALEHGRVEQREAALL